LEVRGAVA